MTPKKGILIVEDENIVALDMRMRLEGMGYGVLDVVDSGAAAVERGAELSPDLVLMDIKLKGGVDGIDAARRLRERTNVPVIFVTAFTDEKTLDRAKVVSPYGYIVKPFHERELRIAIELALYKHQYELSMIRAKELAEEANRLKGEFMANMSHELKTPLNSVIGFTELAMDKAVDPEQRELLAMALGSSKSLLTLIDSILAFTRMEAGRMDAVAVPFSLQAELGDCVDALAVEAYAKGLESSFRREALLPDALVGDSSLLKHALLNLIDNAVKFTDRGRVGLSVSRAAAAPAEGPGGRIELAFAVEDTGIGMEKGEIATAFERFTQLDSSTTRRAGGTGLGLSIVRRNVELMEGSIRVESELGKGTRIELVIPFQLGDAPEAAPPPLAGRAVLAAGFAPGLRAELGEAISALGAEARFADSPGEASPGELVLADERCFGARGDSPALGELNGRLVIATRFGSELRSRLSSRGGIGFVPLPLRSERLAAAVAELAACPRGGAAPAIPSRRPPEAGSAEGAGDATSPEAAALMARLADSIEGVSADGRLEELERSLKESRDRLAEAGCEEGSRIAFSALLRARKNDAAGLQALADKARALAGKAGEGR